MVTSSKETTALMQAIGQVQIEAGPVKKDGENPHFRSTYTTLDSVLAVLKPLWDKHGIVVTQAVTYLEYTGGIAPLVPILTTVVHHAESGQWLSSPAQLVTDRAGPQAMGSAITYMRRYSLKSIFAMEDTDDDAEGASNRGGSGTKSQTRSGSDEPPDPTPDSKGISAQDVADQLGEFTTTTPDYVKQRLNETVGEEALDKVIEEYRDFMNNDKSFTAEDKREAHGIILRKREANKK